MFQFAKDMLKLVIVFNLGAFLFSSISSDEAPLPTRVEFLTVDTRTDSSSITHKSGHPLDRADSISKWLNEGEVISVIRADTFYVGTETDTTFKSKRSPSDTRPARIEKKDSTTELIDDIWGEEGDW